jgi:hypothetical protein
VYHGPFLPVTVTTSGQIATITISAEDALEIPASNKEQHKVLVHIDGYGFAGHGNVVSFSKVVTVSDISITEGMLVQHSKTNSNKRI